MNVDHNPTYNGKQAAWIETFTGRSFTPLNPCASDVSIIDIAHAVSLTPRFSGHTLEFYSVAQHSIHCMEFIQERFSDGLNTRLPLLGLIHDASEAYLCDFARPVK